METFYLVDFENVNNEGIENIDEISKDDHVDIFYTENANKVCMDIAFSNKNDNIQKHEVSAGKQSLDMHLASYLGHLLGIHGKQCAYIIISKDKDYDNIIKFWKDKGYPNISRKPKIQGTQVSKKTTTPALIVPTTQPQTVNGKISAGMSYDLSGSDRCELNIFVQQHELMKKKYKVKAVNKICSIVVSRCNEERRLSGIHNDIKKEFDEDEYSEIYEDVKSILSEFVAQKSKDAKRESKVRSFFGQHFRKKIYVDKKEPIIGILINAKSKQQVNNELMKLYTDSNTVKHIYQTVQPLLKDLPGR